MVNVYAKNTTMNIGEIISLYIVAYLLVTQVAITNLPRHWYIGESWY